MSVCKKCLVLLPKAERTRGRKCRSSSHVRIAVALDHDECGLRGGEPSHDIFDVVCVDLQVTRDYNAVDILILGQSRLEVAVAAVNVRAYEIFFHEW